jgi:hypothetical protein
MRFHDEILKLFEKRDFNQEKVPVDVDWHNTVYSSKFYRWIHIEYYYDKALEVLHFTAFPGYEYNLPIFGLDIIKTRKNDQIRAIFHDETPTVNNDSEFPSFVFENSDSIELPQWSSIFSDKFIAIRPNTNDIEMFSDYILNRSKYLIVNPKASRLDIYGQHVSNSVQERYCLGQRKNKHTMAALIKKVGKEKAELFMEKVLFPC